jgi:hypothetical protein
VTAPIVVLSFVVAVLGCSTTAPIQSVSELAGDWQGRVANPTGHARAAIAIAADGIFKGTMFLDGGDRSFYGALIIVRPGQVRYQGTDGNGTVRVFEEHGQRVLKFQRDGGGVDAVFRQF